MLLKLHSTFDGAGGENEGLWLLPDILVNVHRPDDDAVMGVVQEVMVVCYWDCTCTDFLYWSGIWCKILLR